MSVFKAISQLQNMSVFKAKVSCRDRDRERERGREREREKTSLGQNNHCAACLKVLLFILFPQWISNKSPWNPADASNHILNDEKNRYSNITACECACGRGYVLDDVMMM